MPSRKAVVQVFEMFNRARLGQFPATNEELRAMVDFWEMILYDVDDAEIVDLAVSFLRTGEKFMPTPGQVLQMRAAPQDEWADGWDALLRSMSQSFAGSITYDRTPPQPKTWGGSAEMDEGIRGGLNALGGWYCAKGMQSQSAADRAAFRDAFRSRVAGMRARESQQAAAGALTHATALRLAEGGKP